ncbi:hypothetical protein CCR75_008457 [Bremia lactucae]|uniref:Uncharacterized protein n=1 Tax=Bremia lactucae TaxID=4779 RepID=A0A976IKV2_BRELC|nr:hypothetical protein CCR75_008457 [Bremia lactucae]
MSHSPWNADPVTGQKTKINTPAPQMKTEEHAVWNAAPKPNVSTSEKVKDKTRNMLEDAKDIKAKVTSTVEGYKNDSVAKVKKMKQERKLNQEVKKAEKEKKAEESAGACGLCGCTVM